VTMLAISFAFPGGRYHATPWGRHVNEADVEWPPSPWRILRTLIAIWHRKLDPAEWPEAVLESLVVKLAERPPVYSLPYGVSLGHTRHYMPVIEGAQQRPTLIFDAFVRIPDGERLVAVWPEVELAADERQLLAALTTSMGYLGRAESWVEAEPLLEWSGKSNCRPAESTIDRSTGVESEPVSVIAPRSADDYQATRAALRSGPHVDTMTRRERAVFERTVPDRLLDALRVESSELQAVGWSAPPGARFVTYQRPYDCFATRPVGRSASDVRTYHWVRFALNGQPLPRIQDSVRIAELVRMAALHAADQAGVEIPAALSGHGVPDGNRHGHAFFLPEDSDGDGRIDRVLIVTTLGLQAKVVDAISRITKIWEPGGARWAVLFEGAGVEGASADSYLSRSRTWISVTPYLHPWYAKRSFGHMEQLKRECRERGIPEPVRVDFLESIDVGGGRQLRAVQFRRIRGKRGLTQPDRLGRLLRLSFADPVAGPIALGFGCHFGLGLFRPD